MTEEHKTLNHLFFDFDSTIITKESLDEVISFALRKNPNRQNIMRNIEDITRTGMEGNLPFTLSLKKRISVVPLTKTDFQTVGNELANHVTEGFSELINEIETKKIAICYIVSGGFFDSILPTAKLLSIPKTRVFTNHCLYDENGKVVSIDNEQPCFSDKGKTDVIEYIKKTYKITGNTCLVGDGANDLSAYQAGVVDHFCGFTGNQKRKIITENSPHLANSAKDLRSFIFSVFTV